MQLDVVKTPASVLPWRLAAWKDGRQLFVPHAHCRLKREILALKAELEQKQRRALEARRLPPARAGALERNQPR